MRNGGKMFVIATVAICILAGTLLRLPSDSFSVKAESVRIHTTCEPSLADLPAFRNCFSQELIGLVPKGLAAVFETLENLLDLDPRFRQGCHVVLYQLGAKTYALYSSSSASNFLVPDASACNYGFHHGFMVALIADSKDPARAGAFCESLDEKPLAQHPDAANQCYHGLGHGLFNMFLPEEISSEDLYLPWPKETIRNAIFLALNACEKAADVNVEGRDNCVGGVFHDIALPNVGKSRKSDPEDPLWFCGMFEDSFRSRCLGNVAQIITDLFPHSARLTEVLSYTRTTYGDDTILASVTQRWGFASDKSDAAVRECQTLEQSLRTSCLEGVRRGVEQNAGANNVYRDSSAFCVRDVLSSEDKIQCVKNSFAYFKLIYSVDEMRQICKKLPEVYEATCAEKTGTN